MRPAQFTATNAWPRRAECAWIYRAIKSFPTPLSPVIRTFPSYGAARPAAAMTSAILAFATANEGASSVVGRMGWMLREEQVHGHDNGVASVQELEESGVKSVDRQPTAAILVFHQEEFWFPWNSRPMRIPVQRSRYGTSLLVS